MKATRDDGGRPLNGGRVAEVLRKAAPVRLPTPNGEFDLRALEMASGNVYVAASRGEILDGDDVLCRLHSECLTGDVLGSLRCDCGTQLRQALRLIDATGRGVFIYATGHEGRGIGLVNKLLAYAVQDGGADTVDANLMLGLPVDGRDYGDAAAVLRSLGVRSVRLLTNNPAKAAGLQAHGTAVTSIVPLPTAGHSRNGAYLRTKQLRLGHGPPGGPRLESVGSESSMSGFDVSELLGVVRPRATRPYVVVKYAQTLDGRIATTGGRGEQISGTAERTISHGLRAACDSVLVGVGTVIADDPQLTVRLVPGASPARVVLDSTLRIPLASRILDDDAVTTIVTGPDASETRRDALLRRGVRIEMVESSDSGIDIAAALLALRRSGTESLLVEGGARVITALLAARVVDRLIVGIAPVVIGRGLDAVGDIGVRSIAAGVRLDSMTVHRAGADVLLAGEVSEAAGGDL